MRGGNVISLKEFDVPADGTCLFYCVMFSVLLPLVKDADVFRETFIYLFGEEVQNASEEVRQLLLRYDGSSYFINRNEAQLEVLVDVHFRKRIVDFMRAHKETFQDFYYEDETFEERLAKIEKPKAWGDETEVQTISHFLKRRIVVLQNGQPFNTYGEEYDQSTAIYLVFVSASGQKGETKNHYHFQLDEKRIPSLLSGRVDERSERKKAIFPAPSVMRSVMPEISKGSHSTIQKNSHLKKSVDKEKIETAKKDLHEYLEKTAELLKSKDYAVRLEEAKKCCVKALKSANKLEEEEKQQALSVGFEVLGDIYSKRGDLFEKDILKKHREKLKAVTLYNMSLVSKVQCLTSKRASEFSILETTHTQQPLGFNEKQQRLIQKIQQIENELILFSGGVPVKQTQEDYWKKNQESKDVLISIGEKAWIELEEVGIDSPDIQTIYQKIAFGLRETLVKKLIDDCFQLLPLPKGCVYLIMVLGSIAREEATPYSDFEWAILIEDQGEEKNQKHKEYFRRLTELVWIKILNLRETTARMMDIESLSWFPENESPTKKGFSFDGQMMDGCHTPLGNKHHTEVKIAVIQNSESLTEQEKKQAIQKIKDGEYELIGTPEELAEFQQDKWESKRGFQTVLSTVASIVSNDTQLEKSLIKVYEENMGAIWATTSKEEDKKTDEMISRTLIQKRSLKFLAESVERFQFRGGKFDKECHYFDAKYHLYRLPNMVIDHLGSYFNVKAKNLWDRIEALFGEEGVVCNPVGAENLKKTVSLVLMLRLRSYLAKGYRDDHIIMFDSNHLEESEMLLKKYLGVSQPLLFDIYSVLISFQYETQAFIEKNNLEVFFSHYYDSTPFSKGFIYELLLNYSKAEEAYKEAKDIFTNLYGAKDIAVADTLNNLGNVYEAQGKYPEAIAAYEEAKRIQIAIDGEEHISVAMIWHNLGAVYRSQKENAKALAVYQEAKRIKIVAHGASHILVADTLVQLGNVYAEQGEHLKAIKKYEKAKDIYMYESQYTQIATINNNLGNVYLEQQKYREAIMAHEEAKQIRISFYGPRHILVSQTLLHLGNVYFRQGKYSKALKLYNEARSIRIARCGPSHILMSNVLSNLGNVYEKQGEYPAAIKAYKGAKDICIATCGENHISVATLFHKLGVVYGEQEKYAKAITTLKKAAHIQRAKYGSQHPNVAETLNSLGSVYCKQGKYLKAKKAYKESKHIQITTYGSESIQVAYVLDNLGLVYRNQGKYSKAILAHQEAKDIKIVTSGYWHQDVANTLNNLGNVYRRQEKYEEAIAVFHDAKEIYISKFGPGHIAVADVLYNLGLVLIEKKIFEAAQEAFQEAIDIFTRFHHPSKETVSMLLRISYFREGNIYLLSEKINIERARIFYQKADPNLDPADPDTHRSLASDLYEYNYLSAVIEHYQILIRLKPDDVDAHQKLASMFHVRAQIEKDRGRESSYQHYLKEAHAYFEQGISLQPHADICVEYAQFLWKNRDHYSIEIAIDILKKIVKTRQMDSVLNYGVTERMTVDSNLQKLIDDEQAISLRSYFLSCYLLIQIYCAGNQLDLAQGTYIEFQTSLHDFIKIIKLQNDQCNVEIEKLLKTYPEDAPGILSQRDFSASEIEKQLRLVSKLLEFSCKTLDEVKKLLEEINSKQGISKVFSTFSLLSTSNNKKEIRSIRFYGYPHFCCSENRTRYNMDSQSEKICISLPPTPMQALQQSAMQGAGHGVIRGLSAVIGQIGYSQWVVTCVQLGFYYVMMFLFEMIRFYDEKTGLSNTLWHSSINILFLVVVQCVLTLFCSAVHYASDIAKQQGYLRTSGVLHWIGDSGSYGHYVYSTVHALYEAGLSAVNQIVVQAMIIVQSGIFMEKMIIRVSNAVIDYSVKQGIFSRKQNNLFMHSKTDSLQSDGCCEQWGALSKEFDDTDEKKFVTSEGSEEIHVNQNIP